MLFSVIFALFAAFAVQLKKLEVAPREPGKAWRWEL
jgi:hypothetical protein